MKKTTKTNLFFLSLILLAVLLILPVISTADSFPTKPLTMIIPYKAGGSTDTMGRVLAKALRKELGQPIVVVNRTGGGGTVGATFLKNAAPDGYTFFMGASEIPVWNPLVQDVEFSIKDFRYLAAIAQYQNALITLKEKTYKTLPELIEYSKKNPGVIKCAYQSPLDKAVIQYLMEQ
ncbi:MAG: tripartite tricarboxylate transporter substrate binding protein, partial [Desulfobacteraceae bacterium]